MSPAIIIILLVVVAGIIILIVRSIRSSEEASTRPSTDTSRPNRSMASTPAGTGTSTGASTSTGARAAAAAAQNGLISHGGWREELEDPNLTPQRFVMLYIEAVRELEPGVEVEIVAPLRTKVKTPDGRELVSNLENLWGECGDKPGERATFFTRSFNAMKLALFDSEQLDGDEVATRIIAVVRDRVFIDNIEAQARDRGLEHSGLVYEPLNDLLMVIYVIDYPEAMRYLQDDEIPASIERKDLRRTAIANLVRIAEPIAIAHTELAAYVQAGGTYESSVLLIDGLWDEQQKELGGEVVAAVPARHLLAFCSSNSKEGVAALREFAATSDDHGSRGVSGNLFVWRNGAWLQYA